MALSEREAAPTTRQRPCKLGRLYDTLSKADQQWLDRQFGMSTLRSRHDYWLAEQLIDEFGGAGYFVSWATVRRHRLSQCGCAGQSQ